MRYGSVIGLRAEKLDEYKKLHAAVWPKVVEAMREANIRNFSIYLRKLPDGKYYLFSYMEYVGDDFEGDMKRMAADPENQALVETDRPLPGAAAGSQARRVVGPDGRSVPPGLRTDDERSRTMANDE